MRPEHLADARGEAQALVAAPHQREGVQPGEGRPHRLGGLALGRDAQRRGEVRPGARLGQGGQPLEDVEVEAVEVVQGPGDRRGRGGALGQGPDHRRDRAGQVGPRLQQRDELVVAAGAQLIGEAARGGPVRGDRTGRHSRHATRLQAD